MILTCPDCETRFEIPDNALGEEGRKVRCSACAYVWHQDPISDDADDERGEVDSESTEAPAAAEMIEIPDAVKPLPERSHPEDDSDAPQSKRRLLITAGVVGAVFVLSLIVFLSLHDFIVSKFPASNGIYKIFGFSEYNPAEGLVFDKLDVSFDEHGGIHVSGVLINLTNNDKDLPRLVAVIQDEHGETLEERDIAVKETQISAENMVRFESHFGHVPSEARQVSVSLTLEKGRQSDEAVSDHSDSDNHTPDPHAKTVSKDGGDNHAPPAGETHHQSAHEEPAESHAPVSSDHH
jgi:predicted Zn finger-like uncharacterized protein